MKLSIIYVNYNTTELLLESLASLKLLKIEHEIIVVDNASTNFRASDITSHFPQVRIILSQENLGFGKGNNLGVQEAIGEYVWLLNTDTYLPTGHHIDQLVEFLDKHTDYGAASPLLTNKKGVIQPTQTAYFPTPGKTIANIGARIMSRIVPGATALYGRANMDYLPAVTRDVEVAVAAALLVRREVYEAVGGFSPEFFMFYEDSDLCRKIWQAGYKIRFFTQAHIVHLWGQSITGNKAFITRKNLYFSSQDIYLHKWHSAIAHFVIILLRLPLRIRYKLLGR